MRTLGTKLTKSLMESEFFLINDGTEKHNLSAVEINNHNLISLRLDQLLKEFKFLMKIFYFLSRDTKKNDLSIFLQNSHFYFLIKNYISENKITFKINLVKIINQKFITTKKRGISLFFMLSMLSNTSALDKKFLDNKKFFTHYISMDKNSLFYHMRNKLDDDKKILLLLALLETVFKFRQKKKNDKKKI
jgi:hypothetical protein